MTDAERELALVGPRALKESGSTEWCWQTVDYLQGCMRHVDKEWREAQEVLNDLISARAWKIIPPGCPYGTLNRMLKAEIGLDQRAITAAIRTAELAAHGGDRRSTAFQADNVSLKKHGNSESYTYRRLRRDRPDLAEKVDRGEMSANKAAIEANIRPRTISVRPTDAASTARSLRKHMNPDQLALLVKHLQEEQGESDDHG